MLKTLVVNVCEDVADGGWRMADGVGQQNGLYCQSENVVTFVLCKRRVVVIFLLKNGVQFLCPRATLQDTAYIKIEQHIVACI